MHVCVCCGGLLVIGFSVELFLGVPVSVGVGVPVLFFRWRV